MSEQQWERIWPESAPRTFVNPHDITTVDSVAGTRYVIQDRSGDCSTYTFNASEFNVRVEFIPKATIVAGDIVRRRNANGNKWGARWDVVWVKDGHAWLSRPDNIHAVVSLDDIEPV